MIEGIRQYLDHRGALGMARDLLDILIVYYVVYRALLVLRGTRAMQVGVGLGVVFVLYIVAQLLQLVTVLTILGALISSIILLIVVVFQNDIRRGLQRVGSRAWFGSFSRSQESKVIDEVVDAATDLARHRIGAIITFEQDANLDEFVGVHKGHAIDAAVSRELLVSLFIPEAMNKLHDGAVIVRNLRIAKAGVFFPMPEGRVVDDSFGSRHRAALGITEETDAVVVVVSEERGTISFCFNGNIASNLDGPKLRTMLETIFSPKVRRGKRKADARRSIAPSEPPSAARRISEEPPSKPAPRPTPVEEEASPGSPAVSVEPSPPTLRGRAKLDSEPPAPLRPRQTSDAETSARTPPVAPLRTPVATAAVHIHTPPAGEAPSSENSARSATDPELERGD
jgi:uncharacterized protein (TIGR00159 family)